MSAAEGVRSPSRKAPDPVFRSVLDVAMVKIKVCGIPIWPTRKRRSRAPTLWVQFLRAESALHRAGKARASAARERLQRRAFVNAPKEVHSSRRRRSRGPGLQRCNTASEIVPRLGAQGDQAFRVKERNRCRDGKFPRTSCCWIPGRRDKRVRRHFPGVAGRIAKRKS